MLAAFVTAWLGGSLARGSLSGIPRCGLSNSWQPLPAQSQVLAAGGSAAPGASPKERRTGGDLSPPQPSSLGESGNLEASQPPAKKALHLLRVFISSDRDMAFPLPGAATLFLFLSSLLSIDERIGGLTEKEKLSVKRFPRIAHGKDRCETGERYHPEF